MLVMNVAFPLRAPRTLRFDRIAMTSVFGDPRDRRSWSGAPANLADALERLGVAVEGIHPRLGVLGKLGVAAGDMLSGHGRPINGEHLLRSARSRQQLARQVADEAARLGVEHVLHTGSLDLPASDLARGVKHYLYCDHSWALAKPHRIDIDRFTRRALASFERSEQESLGGLTHVFTFGAYVRDNLIRHYGLPPERVTAVGSGMGAIEPNHARKDFSGASLLFVAKHLFREKGGFLLLDAFRLARRRRSDLTLTIVGDERTRAFVPGDPAITFHGHLPWADLQRLFRDATLLVQPMLNDPWGQVYLEALVSRTPVLGLSRNGLPEIVDGGRYGFLVRHADPEALSHAILEAVADPARLERMALGGQRHVLGKYSWDRVAERIAYC
jgi:glycosyltransferase involved in cell wall biosynthesis